MTIVGLKKITLYGPVDEKTAILEEMQNMGCLHIIPLTVRENILDKGSSFANILEALKYLQTCPTKLKAIKEVEHFDPALIEAQALQNKRETEHCIAESDSIKKKIEDLIPWGNFVLPDPKEIGDQQLWFYLVPHHEMKKIDFKTHALHKVNQDHRFCYVVVLSKDEPEVFPGARVKLDKRPLKDLKKRLEEIEFRLEDLYTERIHLTRWLYLFEKNLYKLEDQKEMNTVTTQTHDAHSLFALQAWIPQTAITHVLKYGEEKKLAVVVEQPTSDEVPPTLLKNKPLVREGEDLLSFYMTPSYWLWDPSTAIFFSFAIFFAMIFSDAGYALLLGLIIAYFWKKLGKTETGKRFRALLVVMALCSLIWGILVGSYFGIAPKPSNPLSKLHVLNIQNYSLMMGLAIGVGVAHIMFANLALAWSLRKSRRAIAHVGWAVALFGAVLAFIGYQFAYGYLKTIGFWVIGIALGLVVLFSSVEKKLWKRVLNGFIGLTRVSGIFGDVLSYLRLFALGLASASLATVFNNLAQKVYTGSPAFKIVFFLLIILVGHGINFLLSIMSGFIHGLRLNFIEFFNWSVPDEGTPFKAFSKREGSTWSR